MVNFGRDSRPARLRDQAEGGRRVLGLVVSPAMQRAARARRLRSARRRHLPIPTEGKDILCIAGGSGIAGMLSIIERARPRGLLPRPYRPRLLRRAHPGGRVLSAASSATTPAQRAGTAGGDARPLACAGAGAPRIRSSLISASWQPAWWRMSPDAGDERAVLQHGRLRGRPADHGGLCAAHVDQGGAPVAAVRPLRQVRLSGAGSQSRACPSPLRQRQPNNSRALFRHRPNLLGGFHWLAVSFFGGNAAKKIVASRGAGGWRTGLSSRKRSGRTKHRPALREAGRTTPCR